MLLTKASGLLPDGAEEYDSEGSDSEEDDDYEGAPNGIFDAEEESDEEESSDSDEADGFAHRSSSVIIEEVHDGDHDTVALASTTAVKVQDNIYWGLPEGEG